jgi:xyloglucan galactosyltransferase MUR3
MATCILSVRIALLLLLSGDIQRTFTQPGNTAHHAVEAAKTKKYKRDKYFYIYEWPSYLDDVWPPPNATLHVKSGYDHGFYANRGAGQAIKPELGLFQTWQFSLYKNLMARLRTSDRRTRDPSKASAFIVPFDLGVHSYIDHRDGFPRLAAPHGRYAGRYLRQNCQGPTKNLWWKNNGHDHFLIFSITAYQMVGMMVKELFMFVCQNCTTITIETSPTGTAPPGRTRKHWYAAPYPSSYHYWEGIKELPWEPLGSKYREELWGNGNEGTSAKNVKGKNSKSDSSSSDDGRDILSLFIGSVRTSQAASRELRTKLHSQCQAEREPNCVWRATPHSCNGVVNASDSMLLFKRAKYCPAPSGDSLTRKSLFDSLVAGCVPVLFSRASLTQYK